MHYHWQQAGRALAVTRDRKKGKLRRTIGGKLRVVHRKQQMGQRFGKELDRRHSLHVIRPRNPSADHIRNNSLVTADRPVSAPERLACESSGGGNREGPAVRRVSSHRHMALMKAESKANTFSNFTRSLATAVLLRSSVYNPATACESGPSDSPARMQNRVC